MPSEASIWAREALDIAFEMNGLRATYEPSGGGTPVPCLVMPDKRDIDADAGDGLPPSGQGALRVRASEIGEPAHRGTFTLAPEDGGTIYTVVNRPQPADPNGLVWSMWVE